MTTANIRELQKELGRINLLLEEARRNEKDAALAAIKDYVTEYGITESELLRAAGFLKAKKKRLPAKYYDPSSGNSWSGQGSCPKWLVGKSRDDYLIRETPKPWWPGEDR
ncbi:MULTISPECIES: H-NS family nucleoid-associated regulatory protein [Burkholderia]|uniref:H-NS histone family protein n=1 Tax=Burkholderia TaxID=32008 RepID=UPI000A1A1382|nr:MULTISPECIES: H-NS histone family protein [Burkholderia]ARL17555.1 histone [Burkholderia pseudomallei]PAJ87291.1 histone [Burkholderia ubonensis]PAJ94090.1 histone [Burkholderia ubonensis]PAK09889.1 histone [Burkholderia ubonensis]RQP79794.1 H-NS histone family protein [Burkholderia ubonensis]